MNELIPERENKMEPENTLKGEDLTQFESQLKSQATELKELIDGGDLAAALNVISDLNETRDKSLYLEVGRLTRSLHESIHNFQIDTSSADTNDEMSKIDDASDRLAYVIDLTNKAANKTLDLVEDSMPVAAEMKAEAIQLHSDWRRLKRKEMKPDEFRELTERMDLFLGKMTSQTDKVYQNLSDILLAQDFQDLTGQVIQRVTGLVKEVEDNLVNLVRMAGKVDMITGTVHELDKKEEQIEQGVGPQMNAEQREDVVAGQDDVDDLLSSLGF